MKAIGIDFGSVYFKGIVIDENNSIIYSFYQKYTGNPFEESEKFIKKIEGLFPNERFFLGITSLHSIKEKQSINVNEIIATASGVKICHPEAMSIIEIGGETSKFITLKSDKFPGISDFAVNIHCAAGTGSFIEQQAKRLNLSIEKLSKISMIARKGARIAGRCSVFAKSDMIHLQQKGTPTEEIAYGLCLAIARNSLNTLLLGREIKPPVVIAGGCAKNNGIIRAFSSLLKLNPEEIIVSKMAGLESGIGAAIMAKIRNARTYSTKDMKKLLRDTISAKNQGAKIYLQKLTPRSEQNKDEPSKTIYEHVEGYIGIDVGSVSTDIVVVDKEGTVLSAVYLPTAGNPIRACTEGLSIIGKRFKGGITVLGCGTTGSGRYLAAKLSSADLVKNEITCQMLGTTFYFPDADTIFEIGGQDSKFISLENGGIADFVMNKICSAGTGSFIEEQTGQSGIDIYNEFSSLAFNSQNPPNFSSNCTVFMESELASAQKIGITKEDICAGLSYAIARNYLEKVVGKRRIGKKIIFQGGVASNRAVLSAFQNLLQKEIFVHPYNRISGAIGAAIAVMRANIQKSQFKGFDIKVENKPKTFECKSCSNYCEVTELNIHNERVFFGDVCEKFTSRGTKKENNQLPNLAEEYMSSCENLFNQSPDFERRIGIPRSSFLIAYLPFWWKFFVELGIKPILSSPTSERTLMAGAESLPAATCAPVKIAAGHISQLMEDGIEYVFFPSVASLPEVNANKQSAVCPYTLSIPFMHKRYGSKFISPVLSMREGNKEFVNSFVKVMDIPDKEIAQAFRKALEFQLHFEEQLIERGMEVIRKFHRYNKLIVIGRPYNIFDTYININLFSHLKKLNLLAIPYNYIKMGDENSLNFVWKFSADIFRTIIRILQEDGMFPVILSNFGCGPDAMTFKLFEELLDKRPHLMLEFDEHRGEAGLITRLEAFLDLLENRKETTKANNISIPVKSGSPTVDEMKNSRIYIPYFADHAHALSGALKFAGFDAKLLPPPDEETKNLGTATASGKECHAYAMLLGDLMKLTRIKENKRIYYCFTGTNIPCLLSQFSNGMNVTLDKDARENIRVITPVTEEFLKILGMDGCTKMYEGLLAIEIIFRMRCAIKPYETEPGRTEKIYSESLKEIERAVYYGRVLPVLQEIVSRFREIKFVREKRPKIGIAGDIYTRINYFANENLFNYLEERGFEVIPAPFEIDIIDFCIDRNFYSALRKREILKLFPSALLYLKKVLTRKKFLAPAIHPAPILQEDYFREPNYKEAMMLAEPYFKNDANEVILLNIAKIQDFIKKGVQGVINAMCLNCMVGTTSHAIIERIKRNHDIPIISLVYSATEAQSNRMLLDAFLERVKNSFTC